LETHDDVPEDIRTQLYVEEQQSQDRKRRRHDSGSFLASNPPMIINNYIPGHSSQAAFVLPPVQFGVRAITDTKIYN
jgi:hypothetical protein